MCPSLRSGSPADSALCWHIYRRAVREGAAPRYSERQRQAWAPEAAEPPWMADRLAAGRTWIAETPQGACGFLTATGIGGAGEAHLDLFFVLPEERRQGVADALYAAFAEAAAAAGQGDRMTTFASLLLRPFLERRHWRVEEEQWVERGGTGLTRFRMSGPVGKPPSRS